MFSIFNFIRKSSESVELPLLWYDPAALPGPPILISTAPALHTCHQREKSVQWWNKHTPTVVGVLSPTLTQDEQCQGESQSIYGFNVKNGSSYLPDCSGDISWDTIRCSTEEGGNINCAMLSSPLSSCASIATTLKSGNLSDYCSSNASDSDSNLSMVITDVDHEESFYFPAAEYLERSDSQNDLVATALVLEDLLTPREETHAEAIPFGDEFPPRRASTITRLVGNAIRIRRSSSRLIVDDMICVERSIKPYHCGRSRRYVPHILTTIMEDKDEE
ncbi:hypothetical protein C0992_006700 [Termitomyces sp. T32_za158]|nr:hypothetical protein C0992_006700 [Termitomyces sp. T32_za158]